jgi:rod shape-determining protein MreD
MFVRFLLPFMAVVLFLIEPVFALFSGIEMFGRQIYLVPRFLFMYLLFLAVYYDRKKSMIYGLIFGILYDVVFIDIIGLYAVLFPLFCFLINWVVRYIQQSLWIVTVLTVVFVALLEFIMYEFFKLISFTSLTLNDFLLIRLLPTIIANLIVLIILGWLFKYLIKKRVLQSV